MSKKQKNTVEPQAVEQEAKTSEAIKYNGKISVTVKSGNKIISKTDFHNQGGVQLFWFLCKSLAQEGDSGKYIPKYIRAFYCSEGTPPTTDILNSSTPVCIPVVVNRRETDLAYGSVATTVPHAYLHFTIPFAYFSAGTKINQFALYNEANVKNKNDYCAVFNLTKEDGTWDPIEVTTARGDYDLFIEWSLSFEN